MAKKDGLTARQRYDMKWPRITVRVAKSDYDMLKRMAGKRGQALGPFCADILLAQHCGNCQRLFKRKEPNKIVSNLKDELETTLSENKKLKVDIDMANQYIETLRQEMEGRGDLEKIQDKINKLMKQRKILTSKNRRMASEIERLKRENRTQKETIQSLVHHKSIIQNRLEEWQKWYDTIMGKDSEAIKSLAKEVGVSQTKILRDLIEYGLIHSQDIYIEDLEAK